MGTDYSSRTSAITMLPIRIMGSAPIHVNKTEVNVATTNATTKMVEMSIQRSIKRKKKKKSIKRSVSYMRVIDITSPAPSI